MRLRSWLRRRVPDLSSHVREALEAVNRGEMETALDLLRGRYGEALAVLQALPEPHDTSWLQLAARLLYRSGDMPAAAATAERALAVEPGDAAGWHLLGRVRVWLGDPQADKAFTRATELNPDHFVRPYRVRRARFEHLATAAVERIPQQFHAFLANTLIVVQDLPDLDAVRRGEDPDLLGLYEGATVLEHGLPERIVLYQRNHENVCATEAELIAEIEETVRHEVGHHFGMEEDELPY